jgi:TRAP-type C4-dicarboxylate transport system permease small subunit
MSIKGIYDFLLRVLTPVTKMLFYLGLIFLGGMMFLTAADVIGRYFLNSPVLGSFEITEYLMVIVMATSLAYCGIHKGHVVIELVSDRLSKRAQITLGCVTSFLSLVLFGIIAWQTFIYIGDMAASRVATTVLKISAWPFVIVLAVGFTVFFLVLLLHFLEYLSKALSNE